jgi:hypothetical protein
MVPSRNDACLKKKFMLKNLQLHGLKIPKSGESGILNLQLHNASMSIAFGISFFYSGGKLIT